MAKKQNEKWTLADILTQTQSISPEAIEAVEQASVPREWSRGEAIADQGKLCNRWIFVTKGLSRVMFTRGNKVSTLFFGGSEEIFTSFKSLCDNKEAVFRLEALTDCKGREVSHKRFELLQQEFPELVIFERNALRHQLYALEESYNQRGLLDARERYEKFWIPRESRLLNFEPMMYGMKIPLKIIAQYLGMSPEMLSRIRRSLIEQRHTRNRGNQ